MELAWCGSLADLVESGSNAVDRVSEFGWFDQRNNRPPGGREDSTSSDPKRASAALLHSICCKGGVVPSEVDKVDLVRPTGCPRWLRRARGGMIWIERRGSENTFLAFVEDFNQSRRAGMQISASISAWQTGRLQAVVEAVWFKVRIRGQGRGGGGG